MEQGESEVLSIRQIVYAIALIPPSLLTDMHGLRGTWAVESNHVTRSRLNQDPISGLFRLHWFQQVLGSRNVCIALVKCNDVAMADIHLFSERSL